MERIWAFVGRRTKAKNRGIDSLKGVEGVSVTSTKGKLEVLQKHYQHLGRVSVDSDFDDDWKEEDDSKVEACYYYYYYYYYGFSVQKGYVM